jgi:hypothetical protein
MLNVAKYPDLSCAAFLLIHISLDANVFFAIVSCSSHDVGVFVPPVLALEFVSLSLSRMMTVFTNALSMADILLPS